MSEPIELKGIYAGLPSPWADDEKFDADTLVENVKRCARAGVHGAYILSPAGEFWSVEFDEFKEMATVFREATRNANLPAMVFCCWINLPGLIKRLQCCHELGYKVVQFGFPSWYGFSKDELKKFFLSVSQACPEIKLMHYNSPKQNWTCNADDYLRILEIAPNLIATKEVSWNFGEIADLCQRTPMLSHFFPEAVMLPAMMVGAKGSCSSAIYWQPETTLKLYESIVSEDYKEAVKLTVSFMDFMRVADAVFYKYANADSVFDGLAAEIAGFLTGKSRVRTPYLNFPDSGIEEFRAAMARHPEWVWSMRDKK